MGRRCNAGNVSWLQLMPIYFAKNKMTRKRGRNNRGERPLRCISGQTPHGASFVNKGARDLLPAREPWRPQARYIFEGWFGGAKRDRTADLLHAMQALSQLSYGPEPRRKD